MTKIHYQYLKQLSLRCEHSFSRSKPNIFHNITKLRSTEHNKTFDTTNVRFCSSINIVKPFFDNVDIPSDAYFPKFLWEGPVKNHGNKIALVDDITGKEYTYIEAYSISKKFGSSMVRKLGLKKGDVVALFLHNCPEYITSISGVIGAGGTATTINPSYTATEVTKQLEMANAKIILTSSDLVKVTKQAVENTKRKIEIIVLDAKVMNTLHYDDILQDEELNEDLDALFQVPDYSKDDVVVLPYSSGTTGLPKGVMLTNENLISNICQNVYAKGLDFIDFPTARTQPRTICVLPMFHVFGLLVTSLMTIHAGGKIVTISKFDPKVFTQSIKKHHPTFLHLAPPLVSFLANSSEVTEDDFKCLKHVQVGAAPVGETLVEAFKKKAPNVKFREGWGMTELSPVALSTRDEIMVPGSCGVLISNTEGKIVDVKTGKNVGPNEVGELCIRGPQVMKGYLNNQQATEETIRDGWLHTGDVAYYDEMDRFFIVDRLKELIKVKGFQVAPAELEDLIRSHEDVLDVAVIGVQHEKKGEVPRAYVVLRDQLSFDVMKRIVESEEMSTKINKFVNEHVAEYKRLDGGIEFVDSIPKSAAGKILRKDLRALYNSKDT